VAQRGHCDFRVPGWWRSASCRAFLWKPSRCRDSFFNSKKLILMRKNAVPIVNLSQGKSVRPW
jgi:hypothetical protein